MLTKRLWTWFNDTKIAGLTMWAGDVLRYAEFVDEIVYRFSAEASRHAKDIDRWTRKRWLFSRRRSPDYNQSRRVHLEIESFYVFAKILLDRFAQLIQLFFGPARDLSLSSHHKLSNNIEQF